jgi:hypothetical protein
LKRVVIIVAALVFGLIGLGMSLCGGGFLFSVLFGIIKSGRQDYAGFLVIALPALLIGIALTVVCFRALLKQAENHTPPSD